MHLFQKILIAPLLFDIWPQGGSIACNKANKENVFTETIQLYS